MVEGFVFIKAVGDSFVPNPTERLHGAIIRILSNCLPIEKIHGSTRTNFCLSPIYDLALKMPREFKANQTYFFRIACLENSILDALFNELSLSPRMTLADANFEIIEAFSSNKFEIGDSTDTLYFISPTTFRISKTENLPLPETSRIIKSLSKLVHTEIALPPIKEFHLRSKAINFSKHVLIGCVGYLRFSKPVKEIAVLHFTGLGYSTARGLGSILVKGVVSDEERIEEIHKRFFIHEEKGFGS